MRLDRFNANAGYRNKYAVINMRNLSVSLSGKDGEEIKKALATLSQAGLVNHGEPGTAGEFFVLMLKDEFAREALLAYAARAGEEGGKYHEYSIDIDKLADRAGTGSPFAKLPD